ncbi:MAG TPA: hypothetical protein VJ691_14910 [Vicinamibacterales bacterium]|nr:hypothetical protein [Vicinamibacterales bacterium]
MRSYSAVAAAAIAALSLGAHASQDQTFPSAAVKVWDTSVVVPPSISLGQTPGGSIEDAAGLTRHGTGSPTIVTTYANGTHPRGRSGIAYWNPDGNVFTWYGKTIGFPSGVAINRAGPTLAGGPVDPGPDMIAGTLDDIPTSFGPGDVWVAGYQLELLYVHIAGTDLFRSYGMTAPIGNANGIRAWGMTVDETTGFVYLAEPEQGRLVRLDPVTGRTKVWLFGGQPGSIVFDRAGNFYTEISDHDLILRVNRDDTMTTWRVPSVNGIAPSFRTVPSVGAAAGLPGDNPNGILITDPADNLWFLETNSNEIGWLSGGADGVIGTADDQICEFTSPGLIAPQQVAVTGAGSSLQVYFTEGDGNSVSVLTGIEAAAAAAPVRVCTGVPAEPFAGAVFEAGTSWFDEKITPLQTVIIPTTFQVAGTGGPATGVAQTADGKLLPPILRFSPMPNPLASSDGTPIGDAGNGFPAGLTGIIAGNRLAGTLMKGNKHFEITSGAVLATANPEPTPVLQGRMTGGGTTYQADGGRVHHGIVLHCAAPAKRDDLLSVQWEPNHKFELTTVTSRSCTASPGSDGTSFDTHTGQGIGRYNGAAATAEWTFTDRGKGGDLDTARIVIRNAAGIAVLQVSDTLAKGDQQTRTR